MKKQTQEAGNKSPSRKQGLRGKRRFLLRMVFGIALVLSLVLPMLSPVAHYSLERVLSQSGEVQAEIGFLSLSVFQGEWVATDVALWRDDVNKMTINRLTLSYSFLSFLRGQPWITAIELNGARIPIVIKADADAKQVMIGGFRLPHGTAESDHAPQADENYSLAETLNQLPLMRLTLLRLEDVQITVFEDKHNRAFSFNALQIRNFKFAPTREGVSDVAKADVAKAEVGGELLLSDMALNLPGLELMLGKLSGRLRFSLDVEGDMLTLLAEHSVLGMEDLNISQDKMDETDGPMRQDLALNTVMFSLERGVMAHNKFQSILGYVVLKQLAFKNTTEAQVQAVTLASLDGLIQGGPSNENGSNAQNPMGQTDEDKFDLNTELSFREINMMITSPPASGDASLTDASADKAASPVTHVNGGVIDVAFGGQTNLSDSLEAAKLRIGLAPLSVKHDDNEATVSDITFDWSGGVSVSESVVVGEWQAAMDTARVVAPEYNSKIEQKKLSLTGEGKFNWEEIQQSEMSVSGDVESLTLGSNNGGEAWLGLASIELDGIGVAGKKFLGMNEIRLRNLVSHAKTGKKPFFNLRSVDVKDMSMRDDRLLLTKAVVLQDFSLQFDLVSWGRTGVKSLLHPGLRQALDRVASASAVKDAPKNETTNASGKRAEGGADGALDKVSEPMLFQIDRMALMGNNNIDIRDRGVVPPVRLTVLPKRLTVSDINTANAKQKMQIVGEIGVGEFGHVSLALSGKPFLSKPWFAGAVNAKSISLIPLSGYVAQTIGYLVQSGGLALESSFTLENDMIDMQNKLHLKQFYLERGSESLAAETTSDLGLPLAQALDMLRGTEDNIDLDLPIAASSSDIKVGYQDIINVALRKSLKLGVKKYLLFALQPYGALIYVGQKVGEAATKLSLSPFEFSVGSSAISMAQQSYLEKISSLLGQQSDLHLRLCGVAVAEDAQQWNDLQQLSEAGKKERLLELANRRAVSLKEALLAQRAEAANQLVLCAPRLGDETQKPSVELLIN